MSAIMTAMFEEYEAADRARLALIFDGFPTDRVDLTAANEPGRAALAPARSAHERLVSHFLVLYGNAEDRDCVDRLAARIERGGAAVTVHPRGAIETLRAREILDSTHPLELAQHDLRRPQLEYAAARHAQPWVRALWIESEHTADCIYCRLFERPTH